MGRAYGVAAPQTERLVLANPAVVIIVTHLGKALKSASSAARTKKAKAKP
ncbi:MAG: hypothetical protein LBS77_00190 [Desulfovibrio sp.]|nr:hypothetical protein [Desulfovibrio sp.]